MTWLDVGGVNVISKSGYSCRVTSATVVVAAEVILLMVLR